MSRNQALFSEEELLPISALQHLAFCERQWGLMYLENIWSENVLTTEGRQLHKKSDQPRTEIRDGLRLARGLRLHSLQLGLVGIADVVEFRQLPDTPNGEAKTPPRPGAKLPDVAGLWTPFPVEYKHGKPKHSNCDAVQLCAQALCLEEMLDTCVPEGAFFYAKPRRRFDVKFTDSLRKETKQLITRLRELNSIGKTPPPRYKKWCRSCSIENICLPKVIARGSRARSYLEKNVSEIEEDVD